MRKKGRDECTRVVCAPYSRFFSARRPRKRPRHISGLPSTEIPLARLSFMQIA